MCRCRWRACSRPCGRAGRWASGGATCGWARTRGWRACYSRSTCMAGAGLPFGAALPSARISCWLCRHACVPSWRASKFRGRQNCTTALVQYLLGWAAAPAAHLGVSCRAREWACMGSFTRDSCHVLRPGTGGLRTSTWRRRCHTWPARQGLGQGRVGSQRTRW